MKMREKFICPLELTREMIKDKWKPIILWRLRLGPTSLVELEKEIDGITQRMLLKQLKELIQVGFVDTQSYGGYPFHIEYYLTETQGQELLRALKIMQHVEREYLKSHGEEKLLAKGVRI
ncbi:MAG: helix-turn-helix domain-containing protein [Lachnospiraceae bacterium]|nr:helix-turn-helix domain-containing protein [Lachnospiraceae bacterium]